MGTAWYKMVPQVELLQPIVGPDADVFMEACANFSETHACYACEGKGEKKQIKVLQPRWGAVQVQSS